MFHISDNYKLKIILGLLNYIPNNTPSLEWIFIDLMFQPNALYRRENIASLIALEIKNAQTTINPIKIVETN